MPNCDESSNWGTSDDMLFSPSSGRCYLGGTMELEPLAVVFEDVAQELSGPLRCYLERLVGNQATADDLLQDTLLKIASATAEVQRHASHRLARSGKTVKRGGRPHAYSSP